MSPSKLIDRLQGQLDMLQDEGNALHDALIRNWRKQRQVRRKRNRAFHQAYQKIQANKAPASCAAVAVCRAPGVPWAFRCGVCALCRRDACTVEEGKAK